MNFPSLIEKQSIATHRFKLNIWDVGGQKSLRSYWRNYFESTDGLIWVVDSADRRRLADCKEELKGLLLEEVPHVYSFFLRVVSRASKPDGILVGLQILFGLPAWTKVQNYVKEWWKNCVQLEHFWLAFYFHYGCKERVLTELLSITGYRPRLNTVYLRFTSSHTMSVSFFLWYAYGICFLPYKAAAPVSPLFSIEGSETSSINCHILMLIRHQLLLHLFFCGKNAMHLDE